MRLRRKTYAQRFAEAYGEGVEDGLRASPLGAYMADSIPHPTRLQRAWRWAVNMARWR